MKKLIRWLRRTLFNNKQPEQKVEQEITNEQKSIPMSQEYFTTEQRQQEDKTAMVVSLSGNVSINKDLQKLQSTLANGIAEYDRMIITAEEQVNGDIAFIQLIIAAIQQARQQNTEIKLDLQWSGECCQLLDKAGLLSILKTCV